MTTDNKTLADVQPGGRVRLGDQAERARFEAWALRECLTLHRYADGSGKYSYDRTDSAWKVWQYLSAQPSPGGQGDRPLRVFSAGVWTYDGTGQSFSHEDMDAAAFVVYRDAALAGRQPVVVDLPESLHDRVEALREVAARQPVGEPVIDYEDLVDQAKDLIQCGCSVNGAFDWLLEQLTDGEVLASPAQAVDLGEMPDGWRLSKKATCYQLSHGNDIIGNLVGPDAEENAAIIARFLDSKAVGNG